MVLRFQSNPTAKRTTRKSAWMRKIDLKRIEEISIGRNFDIWTAVQPNGTAGIL